MKALLWLAAVAVALILLISWKLLGREPRVLRGRVSPALLRMAVMLLIVAGVTDDARSQTRPQTADDRDPVPLQLTVRGRPVPATPDPAPLPKDFPPGLSESAVRNWAVLNGVDQERGLLLFLSRLDGADAALRNAAVKAIAVYAADHPPPRGGLVLPPAFRAVLAAELPATPDEARKAGRSLPNLIAAADQLAAEGLISNALVAYLWRTAPADVDPADAPALADLYARLESHARMHDALILAQAETGPVKYVPWMSKAARPEGDTTRVILPPGLADAARRRYATTPAGPWETDAAVSFRLATPATLYRRGQKLELNPGQFVRLRRLDVLVAPAGRADHRLLGDLKLPPVLTSRRLADHLTPDADARVAQWVVDALAGDPDALKLLEMTLPAARKAIDTALADPTHAAAPGAPALRLLRSLYDE